jgi:hypothetical protein
MTNIKLPKQGESIRIFGLTKVSTKLLHKVIAAPNEATAGITACGIDVLSAYNYNGRHRDEAVDAPANRLYCAVNRKMSH